MNRFFSVICLSLIGFSSVVLAAADGKIRDYPLDQVAEHSYVIHGPLETPNPENQGFMNNPGFVVTEDSVVVVDPGSSLQAGRLLVDKIRSVTDKPVTHVLSTHIHGDHWLGNQAIAEAWPDAVFYAHPAMIEKANAGAAQQWVETMSRLSGGFTDGTVALVPDHAVEDGGSWTVGGMTFRFYAPEAAHSHSDVMIEVVEDSLVFLGDNVLYERLPRMSDGTFKGNIAACDVALGIGAAHYVPGHGPSGGVERVKAFREYLTIVHDEVERLYEEDMEGFEMKPLVIEKLSGYKDWSGFDEQVGKHTGQALLEVEAEAF